MPVIDADAHVVETEQTWEYMDPEDLKYRPQIVEDPSGNGVTYWLIEGKIRRTARGAAGLPKGLSEKVKRNMVTDEAKRFMQDIPGRVAHMDELGIDIQVLYPTFISSGCAIRRKPKLLFPKATTAGSLTSGSRARDACAGRASYR
jgi:hypothetical protein